MIKLYKRTSDNKLRYHEAWLSDEKMIEHWGIVGTEGKTNEHSIKEGESEIENLLYILDKSIKSGFEKIKDEEHLILVIECRIVGLGTSQDLSKRHQVEEKMNEVLGWTGLGHCDGGSSGGNTMEVFCFVVDYELGRKIAEENLRESKLDDYLRIYQDDRN